MNRLIPTAWLRPAPAAFELDRWIQDFWTQGAGLAGHSARADSAPSMNVQETDEAFEVELELPGLALEDIEVVIEGRDLSVRGERKTELPQNATWQRRERFHGRFARAIRLPLEVDASRVQARLHQGVLTITCPKAEAAKARRIPVEAPKGAKELQ